MTGKQFPNILTYDKKIAYVDMVSSNKQDIITVLEAKLADTVAGAHHFYPAACACGEAIYEITRHGPTGPTHFIYQLELPEKLGKKFPVIY